MLSLSIVTPHVPVPMTAAAIAHPGKLLRRLTGWWALAQS